jgi:hypothetical protein
MCELGVVEIEQEYWSDYSNSNNKWGQQLLCTRWYHVFSGGECRMVAQKETAVSNKNELDMDMDFVHWMLALLLRLCTFSL